MTTIPQESRSWIARREHLWASVVRRRQDRIRRHLRRPLHQELLRNLFLAGALLVDVLLPLQLMASLSFPASVISSLVALCLLLYIEWIGYERVWGTHGRWSAAVSEDATDSHDSLL